MKQTSPNEDTAASVANATLLLAALVDRLRPPNPQDSVVAESRIALEIERLRDLPEEAGQLGAAVRTLLAMPHQAEFYADTGIRTSLGFWLELGQRTSHRLLPSVPDASRLHDRVQSIFHDPQDHAWVASVSPGCWMKLSDIMGLEQLGQLARDNLLGAARALSFRLAGAGLDQEVLRADPSLNAHESPFLAQNALLIPLINQSLKSGVPVRQEDIREVDTLLDQCHYALDRIRRRARETGISIRLTYSLARMHQLISRLRELFDLRMSPNQSEIAVRLLQVFLQALQTRYWLGSFVEENISLLSRNVTDHASRHGEHYIAENRSAWLSMLGSGAIGGIIIALMALLKVQMALWHLPRLTEGIAFGLNYGIGFVLIHMVGGVVATKQPAMTAATIAATLEDARPRDLGRLNTLARNVASTQFVAVMGNVLLALPLAALLTWLWPKVSGSPMAPPEKMATLLREMHPIESAALYYAAIAGIGLFLSGLISGYFDNQARYHDLGPRIAWAPRLAWLGRERALFLGNYIDAHYGAILGNLFFGMYLGLMGAMGTLTGLPLDIRHVAFSSANLGMVLAQGGIASNSAMFWAIAGLVGIAIVNLTVSFSLALYVAVKSRSRSARDIGRLGMLMLKSLLHHPFGFLLPPAKS